VDFDTPDLQGALVQRVPITGGAAETIGLSPQFGAGRAVAVDAEHVYWAVEGPDAGNTSSTIFRANKDGTGQVALATNQPSSLSITLTSDEVFWTNTDDHVVKVAKTGGPVTQVSQGESGYYGAGLAVDDTTVYWAGYDNLTIYFASRDGGGARVLANTAATPTLVKVDADAVYWSDWGANDGGTDGGGVYRASKSGGQVVQLASGSGENDNGGLALDDTWVYFIRGNRVMRVAKTGGTPETVWQGPESSLATPVDVAVTSTHIYWVTAPITYENENATVYRQAK
jgi:hypothetical protein